MALIDADVLEREIHIAARPEAVFAYFIDPVKMIRWKGLRATLDPRPGGTYRVEIDGRDVASGQYLEVVPFSRIVFTWGWEGENSPLPPGASTVEVTFTPDGNGTLLRLRHHGLPNDAMHQRHAQGWDHYLPRLHTVAQGGDPGPDPMAVPDQGHL